jgi:ribosome-binding protein aMBF1 (putative translation factor)
MPNQLPSPNLTPPDPKAIRDGREARGWSQETLAKFLNVTWSTVQRWEANKTKPGPIAREALRKVLGI